MYNPQGKRKYCHLSVIMDAFTKEALAYVCRRSLQVDFILETVNQMLEKHGSEFKADVIVHSGQWPRSMPHPLSDLINDGTLRQSIVHGAICWDSVPRESFFGRMKEGIQFTKSDCYPDIARKIDDWIDYYNKDRYQWLLTRLSLKEYYHFITSGIYPLSIKPPSDMRRTDDIHYVD